MEKEKTSWMGIILIVVLMIGWLSLTFKTVESAGAFAFYRSVTVDADLVYAPDTPGYLIDFPVLISRTISDLATTGNGGDIENTVATGGASGSMTVPADFDVGADSECSTSYSYEFEYYDETTGEIVLWVAVPELSENDDTTFYLCYGDSGQTTNNEDIDGTWDAYYVAVYHLEGSGTFYDSSGNGNDLTATGTSQVTGAVGHGLSFNGTSDKLVNDGDDDSWDFTGEYLIETWMDLDDLNGIQTFVSRSDELSQLMIANWGTDTNAYIAGHDLRSNNDLASEGFLSVAGFHYLANRYNYSTKYHEWYHDGFSDGDKSDGLMGLNSASNADVWISGESWASDRYVDGKMDEIRISSDERTDAYVRTVWYSIDSEDTFVTLGSEVENATPTPTASDTPTTTPTYTPTPTSTPTPPAIVMGNSSDSAVPTGAVDAIATALATYRPDSELGLSNPEMANMWALTYVGDTDVEDYYWVGLTGLIVDNPADPDGWNLGQSLWNGLGLIYDNGDTTYDGWVSGSVGYTNELNNAGIVDLAQSDGGGTGSATYYFPWAPNYVAYFGKKGIHDDVSPVGTGYGGMGWLAIDWVGGATYASNVYPNAVYVSQSGASTVVCRDSVQTWVRIGDFLYGHLNDNETLENGVYHSQGSYLGSLITGTHSTKCGSTSQQDTSYHLHIGFKPDGNYFQWEDWVLDISAETFRRGGDSVGVGEYMLAEWAPRVIIPTPGPTVTPGGPTVTPIPYGEYVVDYDQGGTGGHIWDGFISGLKQMVQARVDYLQGEDYDPPDLPEGVTFGMMIFSGIRIAVRTLHVLLTSSLNLTMSLFVFMMVVIMEPIRFIIALWKGIKSLIPFL